jgi:DNA-binding phage protein
VVGTKEPKIKIFFAHSNIGQIFRGEKVPAHKSYHRYLIESLKDPTEAAAYLDSIVEDGDLEHIVLALKNVAEARGSLVELSTRIGSNWENFHQLLARRELPELLTITELLSEVGLKLSVTVKEEQAA